MWELFKLNQKLSQEWEGWGGNHHFTVHPLGGKKKIWSEKEEIFFSSLSKLNQSSSASDDVKSTADEWKICYKYRRHKKEKRQAGVYISLSVIAVNICRAKQWTRSRLVHAIWKKNYFHFRSFMLVSSSGAGDMFTCSILFYTLFVRSEISCFVLITTLFYCWCKTRVSLFWNDKRHEKKAQKERNIIFYSTLMRLGNISVFFPQPFIEINARYAFEFFFSWW